MTDFILDPRLEADTTQIGRLALSRVLLNKDARFPWIILVPERPDMVEIFDLSQDDRAMLLAEACAMGTKLKDGLGATKINIANLGNAVAQLHVHVVARFDGDAAWPGPIWNSGKPEPRTPDAQKAEAEAMRKLLGLN